jgi:hypothetical protein
MGKLTETRVAIGMTQVASHLAPADASQCIWYYDVSTFVHATKVQLFCEKTRQFVRERTKLLSILNVFKPNNGFWESLIIQKEVIWYLSHLAYYITCWFLCKINKIIQPNKKHNIAILQRYYLIIAWVLLLETKKDLPKRTGPLTNYIRVFFSSTAACTAANRNWLSVHYRNLGNIWETSWAWTAHSAPYFLNNSSHFCHFVYLFSQICRLFANPWVSLMNLE